NTLPIVGPMARNVQDCALFLSAISGADSRDPLSLGRGPLNCIPETEPDIRGVRIALSPDFHGQIPFDAEIPTVVERAGKHFEALGCRVSHACPDFTGADEAFKIHRAWSMAARHGEALQRERHLYKETLAWNIEQGLKLGPADLTRAEQLKSQLHLRMSNFFEDYDYLLVPTTQVLPFEASEEYPRVIAGVAMETYIDWMKSCYYLSNLICPVISVPAGFSREGLPIGLQIVGRPMDEAGVLRMAQALEHATGFSRLRPG
ncbi:MAG: amidase, partial [Pseudomonadales bacterium]|nr:amidase [Pseudomonadales bacterium]